MHAGSAWPRAALLVARKVLEVGDAREALE
jgi:hypothetical protein